MEPAGTPIPSRSSISLELVTEPRISESVALVLAVAEVMDREPETTRIRLEARLAVPVRNQSLSPEAEARFTSHPDRYYLFAIRLGDKEVHVVGMNSKAEPLFHHVFPLGYWHF